MYGVKVHAMRIEICVVFECSLESLAQL